MKVEYAKRAVSDLQDIAAYHADCGHWGAGAKIAMRIQDVVERIANLPESGRPVHERPGVRVVPLRHYRYNVFYLYQAPGETVRVLHIRHTSRQPWR